MQHFNSLYRVTIIVGVVLFLAVAALATEFDPNFADVDFSVGIEEQQPDNQQDIAARQRNRKSQPGGPG